MKTDQFKGHTPGPWESDPTGKHYDGHVIRRNGVIVCRMQKLTTMTSRTFSANVALITYAPELLAQKRLLEIELEEIKHALKWALDRGKFRFAKDDRLNNRNLVFAKNLLNIRRVK